jgi:hypothetical protein
MGRRTKRTEDQRLAREGRGLLRRRRRRRRRLAELACFEQVLGAVRVVEPDGRCHHRRAGDEFPAAVPAGEAEHDEAWAVGYGGPRFTEDRNEVALLEASLKLDGLQQLYVETLGSLMSVEPGDASPEMVFRLTTARPDLRVLAVLACVGRGREEGRI